MMIEAFKTYRVRRKDCRPQTTRIIMVVESFELSAIKIWKTGWFMIKKKPGVSNYYFFRITQKFYNKYFCIVISNNKFEIPYSNEF